jgi:ubiquinol-cytochrome c reductase cytochrome c subunit
MRILRKLPALVTIAVAAAVLGGLVVAYPVDAQSGAPAGDVARGKAAFLADGCYECHGTVGQGNRFSGPKLAPHPIPYSAYIAQLRKPRAEMPPYSAKLVSDTDAANIYAYLSSIPASKTAAQIPLLASVDVGNPGRLAARASASDASLNHGRMLYAANCAACHGAVGTEGGVGPSLKGEKSRKNHQETVAWIKNPAAPMPKLYPSPLSEKDVNDVAAYVESL